MSRKDAARLGDIVEAVDAIRDHLTRGGLDDGLVYDAIRVRLIEIGEAVKASIPAFSMMSLVCPGRRSPGCGTNLRTDTSTPTTRSCKTSSTMTSTRADAVQSLIDRIDRDDASGSS